MSKALRTGAVIIITLAKPSPAITHASVLTIWNICLPSFWCHFQQATYPFPHVFAYRGKPCQSQRFWEIPIAEPAIPYVRLINYFELFTCPRRPKIQLWWKWRILHLSRGRSVSISKSSHGHSAAYLQLSVMGWNADAQALVSRKNECYAWVLSRSSRGKSPPFLPPSSGIACMGSQSDPAHSGCRPCCERLHVKE